MSRSAEEVSREKTSSQAVRPVNSASVQSKSSEPEKKSSNTGESSQKKDDSPGPSQTKSQPTSSAEDGAPLKLTDSMRRIVVWTMTGFFDWNPAYFIQMRGLMNIIHTILSLTVIVLLGTSCQLRSAPNAYSDGFYCKPPEVFLFVVSCCSFFTTVLYLFCCMLSKKTDALLFQTSFEISYYILYFILLLTASIALMISAINWDGDRTMSGGDFESIHTAAVIGLLNSVMYGVSSVWFFISHRYYRGPEAEVIVQQYKS